jgi:hypothetical protein
MSVSRSVPILKSRSRTSSLLFKYCRSVAAGTIAALALAPACDWRMGVACRTDSQCGSAGLCIEGLCFAGELPGVGGGRPDEAGACDAGESNACSGPVGGMCLRGNRVCDAGTWGGCVLSGASNDSETCGPSCAPCGVRADRCDQGTCKCGTAARCEVGQRCVGGACACDSTSCSGCCSGLVCQAISFPLCRLEGQMCLTCDLARADRCAATGGCQCGTGPQCAVGQRCSNGACVCDASSCPLGCCDGSTCRLSAMSSCGVEGRNCAFCDPLLSDRCLSIGSCACGSGPPCIPGQRCLEGLCICDPCASGLRSPDPNRSSPVQ